MPEILESGRDVAVLGEPGARVSAAEYRAETPVRYMLDADRICRPGREF